MTALVYNVYIWIVGETTTNHRFAKQSHPFCLINKLVSPDESEGGGLGQGLACRIKLYECSMQYDIF